MGQRSDDDVGKPQAKDDGHLSEAQRRIIERSGEAVKPEERPSSGAPGRSPPIRGGSSQGTGDRAGSDDQVDADRSTGRHPQPRPGEG